MSNTQISVRKLKQQTDKGAETILKFKQEDGLQWTSTPPPCGEKVAHGGNAGLTVEQVYVSIDFGDKISNNLLDVARFHAGVNPISTRVTVDRFADEIFDDAIREYELETRAARGDDCQDVEVGDGQC
ncbi:hypothetical protein DFH29DRAFT_1003046 [Suillus ampliporus]|nr:hypothetical protein DFH29DRAFT_1003046 [Suillus ampliporus]